MLGFKTYIKAVLQELNKHDWSWSNKNRYTDFFDRVATLLDPKTRIDLNIKLNDFSNKWFGLRSITAEHIIFNMQHGHMGSTLIFQIRKTNPYGFDEVVKINIDWMKMEFDLRSIKLWCFAQLNKLIREKDIDFSKESMFEDTKDV